MNNQSNQVIAMPQEQQFRKHAIDFVGRVLNSRLYCIRHNKGRKFQIETIMPIKSQYEAYKNKWSLRGVSKFLINYQHNLLDMTTCPTLSKELLDLLNQSKNYLNEQN